MLVLVHSPMTGPLVWQPVAIELARRREDAIVPEVADHPTAAGPYWEQHARSVARSLRRVPHDRGLVLVAHADSGLLLPAIREVSGRDVLGYVFVDAGIPEDGLTRLARMKREVPQWAGDLETHLRSGGRFPEWADEDLKDAIPLDGLRRGVIEELRPRPLAFFDEPIPVFEGWPDAPCGYVWFSRSDAYRGTHALARERGWPARTIDGDHFHMLVDPPAVAEAILELLEGMSV